MNTPLPPAPKPLGPYSAAVVHRGVVYCSGQIGVAADGPAADDPFVRELARCLQKLDDVLVSVGSARDRVLRVSVYLTDMAHFGPMNDAFAAFFGAHRPARATIGVHALPCGARVEVDCIATVPDN